MGNEAAAKHVQLGSFCRSFLSSTRHQCILHSHRASIDCALRVDTQLRSVPVVQQMWRSAKGWQVQIAAWLWASYSALRWLVQVKKTLRMYIDNYDYHHTTIAKGDDVTGSSMFHFWLHQVPTCTLHRASLSV